MASKETSPLHIIVVKNGSKGDRLLFRYPYTEIPKETVTKHALQHPYALPQPDDGKLQRVTAAASNIKNGQLDGFPDKLLSNLFAVKNQLCGKKFELKVNDVRFVGHPTLLQGPAQQLSPRRQASTLILFNIVLALRANASHSIVRCYHDLSYRLGVALRHEERRCNYLSREAKIMLAAHDEVAAMSIENKESPFYLILQRSQLANDLKQVYEDLCSTGFVQLRINKWLQVSFCLPQRIHQLNYRDYIIDPEALQTCLDALRPYHAILLLVNECELLASFPPDTSPVLIRLIKIISPLKSLEELADDADLSLTEVFQLVGHLVYWAQATVIFPMCETNVYVLSPHAPTSISSPLVDKFSEKFPGAHLLAIMAEFSLPVSLSKHENPTNLPYQQMQLLKMVIWMIQHNLLMQLHTYVNLIPLSDGGSIVSAENKQQQYCLSSQQVENGLTNGFKAIQSSDVSSTTDVPFPPKDVTDGLFTNMTSAEQEAILSVPAASNTEDLTLFSRLYKYFNGYHHLEEIMYYENIRRTILLVLLDKFRNVLVTCEHEDDAVGIFYRRHEA